MDVNPPDVAHQMGERATHPHKDEATSDRKNVKQAALANKKTQASKEMENSYGVNDTLNLESVFREQQPGQRKRHNPTASNRPKLRESKLYYDGNSIPGVNTLKQALVETPSANPNEQSTTSDSRVEDEETTKIPVSTPTTNSARPQSVPVYNYNEQVASLPSTRYPSRLNRPASASARVLVTYDSARQARFPPAIPMQQQWSKSSSEYSSSSEEEEEEEEEDKSTIPTARFSKIIRRPVLHRTTTTQVVNSHQSPTARARVAVESPNTRRTRQVYYNHPSSSHANQILIDRERKTKSEVGRGKTRLDRERETKSEAADGEIRLDRQRRRRMNQPEQTESEVNDGEIRLRIDGSAPLSFSFNADMEGRTLQIIPAEDGMADLVIGSPREEDSIYRSERGSILGTNKRSIIANSARREAKEIPVESRRRNQGREMSEVHKMDRQSTRARRDYSQSDKQIYHNQSRRRSMGFQGDSKSSYGVPDPLAAPLQNSPSDYSPRPAPGDHQTGLQNKYMHQPGSSKPSETKQGKQGSASTTCTNCFTQTSPLWRRDPEGHLLCDACSLFLKLHGVARPLSHKTDVIKKRDRDSGPERQTKVLNDSDETQGVDAASKTNQSSILKDDGVPPYFPAHETRTTPLDSSLPLFSEKIPAHSQIELPSKGVLEEPIAQTPEDPKPVRDELSSFESEPAKSIPEGARWTKIDRRLVNPQALDEAHERFEERLDCVIVLRVLTKVEIQTLANRTQEIREARGELFFTQCTKLSLI